MEIFADCIFFAVTADIFGNLSAHQQPRKNHCDFHDGLCCNVPSMARIIDYFELKHPCDSLQPAGAGFKPAQDFDRSGLNDLPLYGSLILYILYIHVNIPV